MIEDMTVRNLSRSTLVACVLRFFYGITLGHKEALERTVTGREPEKLPPVLSPEEIGRAAGCRDR
jgi:hypothetical protein